MQPDTLTRLCNAFAQLAVDLMRSPTSASEPYVAVPPFSTMTVEHWREAVRLWRLEADELLRTVPSRPCPACDSEQSRFLFVSYDAHPFHECGRCGCWYVPKRVDWTLFDRLFARSPEAGELAARMMGDRNDPGRRDADLARIGGYLDAILPLMPPADGPRAYLDAGCGVGHSLRAGLERGLVAQGVEVDPAAVRIARGAGLAVATTGDLVPPGPYHLLSFWETLEHIAEPLDVLNQYVPLLAEDGLVAITVPNLASPAARMMRESCSWVHGGYNTPGHVNLFHLAALRRLLARAGLSVVVAEGQYSNNLLELGAFLGGKTRGAFDALEPAPALEGGLPEAAQASLYWVSPGVALVERIALTSPILRVVACRQGREHVFADASARHREAGRRSIERDASVLINEESERLHTEVAMLRSKYGRTWSGRLEAARAAGRFSFLKPMARLWRKR